MFFPFSKKSAASAAIAVVGAFLIGVGVTAPTAARADIKIVEHETASGGAEIGVTSIEPTTRTLYVKGEKMRSEVKDGLVQIYDCASNKIFMMNPATKKYAVMTMEQAILAGESSILRQFTMNSKADIVEGGTTRTIAGKKAKNHILSMDTTLNDDRSGVAIMRMKLDGEQWVAESLSYPVNCRNMFKAAYAASTAQLYRAFEPLYDKMFGLKGLPLSSDMTLTVTALLPNGGGVDTVVEFHSEVKGVSTAPLPDSLFKVPASYKRVGPDGLK